MAQAVGPYTIEVLEQFPAEGSATRSSVIFDRHTLLEPDLLVVVGDEVRRLRSWKELPDPALAVEILSPSSARFDRGAKRERYLTRVAE